MKVFLEVRSGSRAGHRMWLADGQQLKVGRTEWADFVFPDDRTMPDVGVTLECSSRVCQATSPSNLQPFFVNGQQVTCHTLKDGDILQVGGTEFMVSVPQHTGEQRISVPLIWTKGPRSSATFSPFPYEIRRCKSGLTCYRGSVTNFPVRETISLLSRRMVLYVLVNVDRAPEAEREGLQMARLVPPSVPRPDDVATAELRLATPGEAIDRIALATRLWENGAATLVYSTREPEFFIPHLAASAFLLSGHEILKSRLEGGTPQIISDAFRTIGGVVLPDGTDGWLVFADAQVRPSWQILGLPCAPANGTPNLSSTRELTDSKRFG